MKKSAVFQKSADIGPSSGHLDPEGFRQNVAFRTLPPSAELAGFVEHFWVLSWDRGNLPPYISEQVMDRPYTDLYISRLETGIQCTFLGKRDYRAVGADRLVGARFRPGAFHGFWSGSVAELGDGILALESVFPDASPEFVDRVVGAPDDGAVALLAALIQNRLPAPDPNLELLARILDAVEKENSLKTVSQVAQRFFKSERWMQQFFSDYVGVGLKWVLLRQRLIEAAVVIRHTDRPDWAALAYELGYSSQQHFITDFKRVVGQTPAQYQRRVQASSPPVDKPPPIVE